MRSPRLLAAGLGLAALVVLLASAQHSPGIPGGDCFSVHPRNIRSYTATIPFNQTVTLDPAVPAANGLVITDIVTHTENFASRPSLLTVMENGMARAYVPVGGAVYANNIAAIPSLTSLRSGIPIKAGAALAVQLSSVGTTADHQVTVSGYVW